MVRAEKPASKHSVRRSFQRPIGRDFDDGGWLTSVVPTRRIGISRWLAKLNDGQALLLSRKANAPELSVGGKPSDVDASAASRENHERIGQAINEACTALQRISAKTAISHTSHYQLSNRIAFAWKLASVGVPTVLVYLGFLGDVGIADAGAPFVDDAHWKHVFAEYTHGVVPENLFETRIDCGAAPTWFLVRSRKIIEHSAPAMPR